MREISFGELEKNPDFGPVWVLNTSSGARRGDVVLTVSRIQGLGVDNLVIPATRVPLDLTTVVSRRQLLQDNQFRRALSLRMLRLLNPDDVQKMFDEDPSARSEFEKVQNILSSGGMREQASAVTTGVEVFTDRSEDDAASAIPGFVTDYVQRIKVQHERSEFTAEVEDAALEKLRNMGELHKDVLKYIFTNLQGISPRIRQLARTLAGAKTGEKTTAA